MKITFCAMFCFNCQYWHGLPNREKRIVKMKFYILVCFVISVNVCVGDLRPSSWRETDGKIEVL